MAADPRTLSYFLRGQVLSRISKTSTRGFDYFNNSEVIRVLTVPPILPPIVTTATISYGDTYTRLGSGSTPASITFTPIDSIFTDSDELQYYIYTGAVQTGALVARGTCTSGSSNVEPINYDAVGLVAGANTLYLSIYNGTYYSADVSFTLAVDTVAPSSAGTIAIIGTTSDPTATTNLIRPVLDSYSYIISFTPADVTSTGASEIRYELRTAALGGGNFIAGGTSTASGLCTSGCITTSTWTDLYMTSGVNMRYLRLIDSGGNSEDFAYSFTCNVRPTMIDASVKYNGRTRTGPNNTPYTIVFTPYDPEQTTASGLQFSLHAGTAPPDAIQGTAGSCTSGNFTTASFVYNTTDMAVGTNVFNLFLHDGFVYSSNTTPALTILRDDSVPTSASPISTTPVNIVNTTGSFTVSFTPVDALSTSTNEILYEIRTASGGGGVLLSSGSCTSNTPATTSAMTNSVATSGSNTLYVRLIDGANNAADFSFTALFKDTSVTSVGPTVTYGAYTRTSVSNTPFTVTFTATDAGFTTTNHIFYAIYTGASQTGSLLTSGSCTSGSSVAVNFAYNAAGLASGSNTWYLSLNNTLGYGPDYAITILRDDDGPASASTVTSPPAVPSNPAQSYALSVTAVDALSTSASELTCKLYTLTGGGGTLLVTFSATSGVTSLSQPFTDPTLVEGDNTRYLRITDGGNNTAEFTLTIYRDRYAQNVGSRNFI